MIAVAGAVVVVVAVEPEMVVAVEPEMVVAVEAEREADEVGGEVVAEAALLAATDGTSRPRRRRWSNECVRPNRAHILCVRRHVHLLKVGAKQPENGRLRLTRCSLMVEEKNE